jgi:hypothetical protein
VELKADLAREYGDLLPPLAAEQWHTIRGRQEIICRYEPDRAVDTLPKLLKSADDRTRFVTLLDRLLADPRIPTAQASGAQRAMHERIRELLPIAPANAPRLATARRKAARA